jgi:glycosyltransferase involved in cell wall biosynthesis
MSARIAIIGPTHPYKGGISQHTTLLAHRIAAADRSTVDLLSWSRQYPSFLYPGQQRVPNGQPEVPVWPRTSYPLSWPRPDGWWRVGRKLRRSGYDAVIVVIITPVQAPAYLTLLTALRRGTGNRPRVVALCHNVLPHEQRPGDRPLTRRVLDLADAILVHSLEQAEVARSLSGTPATVAALPPILGTATAPAAADPAADLPARRQLLFFGLVRPYKGLDILIEALPAVPDVRLTVAGEFWGGTAETEARIARLGLGDRVTLRPGYVDAADVPKLFAETDALVLPYRSATSSANVFLAYEHRVPVIATNVGDMAEQVRDGESGLLCAPADAAALAEALRRLYTPGMLAKLRAGASAIDTDALWQPYVEAVTTLLSNAQSAARKPSPGEG